MFENKKNLRAFVVMAVIMLALIANGIFTLGSSRNNPVSSWKTNPAEYSDASGYEDEYVILSVSDEIDGEDISTSGEDGTGTLVKIWVNVGKIYDARTKDGYGVINFWTKSSNSFTGDPLSSSLTTVEIKKGVDQSKDQAQYSWHMVEVNKFYKYWKIYTDDALEVNEVVFTNKDNVVLPAELVGASYIITGEENDRPVYYEKNELPADSTALNIVDEQDMLMKDTPLTKKYNFTSIEANIVNAALSIGNSDGVFVDENSGALGAELAALGLAVFGVNPLGIRIIPYIFFILTVFLVFALGRRIFNDSDSGLIFAGLYTLLGLGMSIGASGVVSSIGVFFAVLSVLFAHTYYTSVSDYVFNKKHAFKASGTRIIVPVLLSAISFALAFCVDATMLYVLPVLVAITVFGVLKAKKVYAYNASLTEFEDEKLRNVNQYKINAIGAPVVFLVSVVAITMLFILLFYGIVGNIYTTYYSASSLLSAVGMHIKAGLFGTAGAQGEFIKWIIGGGSVAIFNGTQTSIYAAMNVAVQCIALISFIVLTVFVVRGLVVKAKNAEQKKAFKKIAVPYCILTVGLLFSWITFAFAKGAFIADYLLASVFMVGFIPLGINCFKLFDSPIYVKGDKKIMMSTAITVAVFAISGLFFALGYVMFAGIEVPAIVSKILYGWWLF